MPLYNEIRHNLWINNYNPQEAVDNDDGSAYYETVGGVRFGLRCLRTPTGLPAASATPIVMHALVAT